MYSAALNSVRFCLHCLAQTYSNMFTVQHREPSCGAIFLRPQSIPQTRSFLNTMRTHIPGIGRIESVLCVFCRPRRAERHPSLTVESYTTCSPSRYVTSSRKKASSTFATIQVWIYRGL